MGFYGNILTTDLGVQGQIQEINRQLQGLKESYKNQDFIFDGNNSTNNSNNPDYSAADFEERLQALEQLLPDVYEAVGQLYTEIELVRNLLITAQELQEWQTELINLKEQTKLEVEELQKGEDES